MSIQKQNRPITYEVMNTVFHYDGGHEWLKVSTAQIKRVNVLLNQFSHYSYVDDGTPPTYYLEGDCHAELFVTTARNQGIEVVWTDHDDGEWSFIRKLNRINPKPVTLARLPNTLAEELKREAINRGYSEDWLDNHLEIIHIK